MAWTSADSERNAYSVRLAESIKKNAGRLADASDVMVCGLGI